MMSHGLYATANATTMGLRQISFLFIIYFDHASNWIPLSDALCSTHPTAPEYLL